VKASFYGPYITHGIVELPTEVQARTGTDGVLVCVMCLEPIESLQPYFPHGSHLTDGFALFPHVDGARVVVPTNVGHFVQDQGTAMVVSIP